MMANRGDEPGMFHGIPFDVYRAWPGLNMSLLKEITRSPGHLQHRRENPIVATPVMTFGSAVDCLLFDGQEAFDAQYAIKPPGFDGRTKLGKEWAKQQAGLEIVSGAVLDCVTAIRENANALDLVDAGQSQLSIVWTDEETGILCKGRLDLYQSDVHLITDLKTTGDSDPEAFAKLAANYKYSWQAAWYCDGMAAITGQPHDEFMYIVAERDPPHRVEVMRLGMAELEMGRAEYREALRLYAQCEANNHWPTSTGEIQTLRFPGWAFK